MLHQLKANQFKGLVRLGVFGRITEHMKVTPIVVALVAVNMVYVLSALGSSNNSVFKYPAAPISPSTLCVKRYTVRPEMREAIYQMAVDGGFPTNDSGHHQRHGNGMQYSSYSHAIDWWCVNRTLTIIPLHEFIRRLANTIEHRKKQEAEKPKELTLEKAKELLGRCLTMNPQAWQRFTDELSEYGIKSSKPCSE